MKNQKEWESEVRAVFEKTKSHKEPYEIKINNVNITVLPNVFSPYYFFDSKWFAEQLPLIVGENKLLEIGTGTGIVALFCALNGAKVTVTDISLEAVENAKLNFKCHNISAKFYCGDMFDPIPKEEKFDFIFWNHPFNKGSNPNEKTLLKSGFDFNYVCLKKYIGGAHKHLMPEGKLLLGTGNFALLDEIEKTAEENRYKMILVKKESIPLAADSSINNDYRIYEFRR